jgi:hypothetical protein
LDLVDDVEDLGKDLDRSNRGTARTPRGIDDTGASGGSEAGKERPSLPSIHLRRASPAVVMDRGLQRVDWA